MTNKIKVASIVLNNFLNDSRVLKEARSLQNRGFDVTVVALHEESLAESEQIENFQLERIRLTTRGWSKLKLIQLVKYFEFVLRVAFRFRKFDIFHCHDLSALLVGVLIKTSINRASKVVYDSHEYQNQREGMSERTSRMLGALEKLLIHHADEVIQVSNSIADDYAKNYGIAKPHLVFNTPLYCDVPNADLFRNEFDIDQETTIFLYQGKLAVGRGVELVIDAAPHIENDKIAFVFMGYGSLEQMVEEASQRYPNVYYKPAVPPEKVLTYTASADFGFFFASDSCLNTRYSMPNKMFEYLMAGIGQICPDLPDMREFIDKHEVGVVLKDRSVQGIKDAMNRAIAMDREKLSARIDVTRRDYCWETQEVVLFEIYDELVKSIEN